MRRCEFSVSFTDTLPLERLSPGVRRVASRIHTHVTVADIGSPVRSVARVLPRLCPGVRQPLQLCDLTPRKRSPTPFGSQGPWAWRSCAWSHGATQPTAPGSPVPVGTVLLCRLPWWAPESLRPTLPPGGPASLRNPFPAELGRSGKARSLPRLRGPQDEGLGVTRWAAGTHSRAGHSLGFVPRALHAGLQGPVGSVVAWGLGCWRVLPEVSVPWGHAGTALQTQHLCVSHPCLPVSDVGTGRGSARPSDCTGSRMHQSDSAAASPGSPRHPWAGGPGVSNQVSLAIWAACGTLCAKARGVGV